MRECRTKHRNSRGGSRRPLDASGSEAQYPHVSDGRGVAARITALCLDDDGRLREDAYLAIAVRGGLLVDLALAGRLEQIEDSIQLDTAAVGWPPADAALAELGSLDGESLDWWLASSRLGPIEVATALVRDQTWDQVGRHGLARRRCFTERDLEPGLRDLALLEGSLAPDTAADAAVLAIVNASGVPDLHDPVPSQEAQLVDAGSVRWVCEMVTDYLRTARAAERAVWGATPSQVPPPAG